MASVVSDPDYLPPPVTPRWRVVAVTSAWIGFLVMLAWGWWAMELRWGELISSSGNIAIYLSSYFDGSWADYTRFIHHYAREMLITVHMAVWGTLLAVICAIPLGLMSASNVVPWWIRMPIRRFMDATRAINEMVFALMFVAAVGLGPMAGMLALWIHTTGILAKLFSEAVETIDPRPVEGIRATGSGAIIEISYGIVPQVMPLWVSYALYRFESNVRAATVVGFVGGGGIGQMLLEAIRGFEYIQSAAILAIIILSVMAIDVLSSQLRRLVS